MRGGLRAFERVYPTVPSYAPNAVPLHQPHPVLFVQASHVVIPEHASREPSATVAEAVISARTSIV